MRNSFCWVGVAGVVAVGVVVVVVVAVVVGVVVVVGVEVEVVVEVEVEVVVVVVVVVGVEVAVVVGVEVAVAVVVVVAGGILQEILERTKMQTFLPYPDFKASAACLDNKRLGKQRVEVLQILRALHPEDVGRPSGWANHPAVKMWQGYSWGLILYGLVICDEWISRGFKDTCLFKIKGYGSCCGLGFGPETTIPSWLEDESFHASHRSNLLRKNPEFYGRYGWTESNDLPYVWPDGYSGEKK